jgi:hypothetical protein
LPKILRAATDTEARHLIAVSSERVSRPLWMGARGCEAEMKPTTDQRSKNAERHRGVRPRWTRGQHDDFDIFLLASIRRDCAPFVRPAVGRLGHGTGAGTARPLSLRHPSRPGFCRLACHPYQLKRSSLSSCCVPHFRVSVEVSESIKPRTITNQTETAQ